MRLYTCLYWTEVWLIDRIAYILCNATAVGLGDQTNYGRHLFEQRPAVIDAAPRRDR